MMFYALVLTLTTGGYASEFVVDSFRSSADCERALKQTKSGPVYRKDKVTFVCERTKVIRR